MSTRRAPAILLRVKFTPASSLRSSPSRCMAMKRLLPTAAFLAVTAAAGSSPAAIPTIELTGTPQLYTVPGEVGVGRPTAYVTFRTARGVDEARNIIFVRVSGSTGRTFNADDGERGKPHTCFRSALKYFQPKPPPHRLKPGVSYRVAFSAQTSPGERTVFATRTLRGRKFVPTSAISGGASAPSPCRK